MRALRDPLLILIILLSMAIGSFTLTRGHEWGDDFASYIMQAQSILDGNTDEFIERNTFTIFESSIQIGPVAYPWGYPLILTPVLSIRGVHPLALKLPGLILFAGFLFCLYRMTEDRLARTDSLLLVSLFAFNPILIKFIDQILSDIPFLFFVFLALLLIIKSNTKQGAWKYILSGAVMFFAFFIRTTGIILLAGFLVYQASRYYREGEDRKTVLADSVLGAFSFCLLWFISSLVFPDGQGSYLEQLRELTPAIVRGNIPAYFSLFGRFFGDGTAWMYMYYILVVFFLIGAWTRFKADQPLVIFFALYLIALLLWPEWQGMRFIFPLLPIFVYLVFQGMKTVIDRPLEKYRQTAEKIFFGFWLLIVGIFLFNASANAYVNLQDKRAINGPFDPYSVEVYEYIKEKTPADSVIVFFKPRAMRLFTDRDTLMSMECERLALGDYIVTSKKAENSQVPLTELDECALPLNQVFTNRRFIIHEIQK